jgi:hypothetical protein
VLWVESRKKGNQQGNFSVIFSDFQVLTVTLAIGDDPHNSLKII